MGFPHYYLANTGMIPKYKAPQMHPAQPYPPEPKDRPSGTGLILISKLGKWWSCNKPSKPTMDLPQNSLNSLGSNI